MRLFRHLPIFFLCSLLSILFSCSDKSKEQVREPAASHSPHTGGIYRTPLMNSPQSLDPAYAENIYADSVIQQIFDGLVQFNPDLLIIPALAEHWEIRDEGKTYHFFLRENAKFHNGRSVTSQDVLFSLSRLLRTDPPASILPHLLKIVGARQYRNKEKDQPDGIQTSGERELIVHLEEPYAPFLAALGMHQAKIVPQEEVMQKGEEFGRSPVGSGAFRFTSWEENKLIRLERFSDYYAGASYLDEIHYLIYPGGRIEDVFADFQSGKLEDMPISGKVREQLLSRTDIRRFHRPSLSLLFYGVNCQHPLLTRPEVRKALSIAIDREKLAVDAYKSQFDPAKGILPPGMPGYSPGNQYITTNVAEAKSFLDQAVSSGASLPSSIEVVSATQSPVAKAELEFIREAWAFLGITLTPKFIPDWAEFEKYIKSDSVQLYRYAWFADLPDPDSILDPLFGSGSTVNHMRYRNEEVDQMLRTARGMLQPMERAAMYQRIESHILTSFPMIPLVHLSTDRVYQQKVHGIELNPLGDHAMSFHRVWLAPPEQ